MRLCLALATAIALSACIDDGPLVSREAALACGFEEAPTDGDQCLCIGGEIWTHPVDGPPECPEGMTDLGRVRLGGWYGACCLD